MSLNFVTQKLKTQRLEEDEDGKITRRNINTTDDNSGTESDDEQEAEEEKSTVNDGIERTAPTIAAAPPGPQLILNQKPEESACMEPFNEVAPSEDNYSSEEELKEIINEQKLKDGATSRSLKKKQQSASTPLEKRIQVKNNKNSTSSGNAAEKRKWSEVISDDETVEQQPGCEDDLETANSSQRSSRLYVQSAGGNTTASSSCSNEDESCVCGIRRLTTPVQFCTSPPMDVHRPRRKPWTPPPPKVFHIMSNHSASFDLSQPTHEEDEDVEAELEKMSSMPRQAAFVPVNTGSGNDESRRPCSSTSTTSSNEEPNSQYCPRHHQQQQNRHTPSPSKRHRLTPRPHNIQRPCLDFEKMQQIKKRVVTSWRPQGAELSLFCW